MSCKRKQFELALNKFTEKNKIPCSLGIQLIKRTCNVHFYYSTNWRHNKLPFFKHRISTSPIHSHRAKLYTHYESENRFFFLSFCFVFVNEVVNNLLRCTVLCVECSKWHDS